MCVMRLCRGEHGLSRIQLARHPQRFEICHRATTAQVAQVRGFPPADHARQFGDCFLLHGGAGTAAVEGVVVRIDPQRQLIGEARDRMWRLQHLAGVQRMKVGVVVVEPVGDFVQHVLDCYVVDPLIVRRETSEARPQPLERFTGLQRPSSTSGPTLRECFRAVSTALARRRAS